MLCQNAPKMLATQSGIQSGFLNMKQSASTRISGLVMACAMLAVSAPTSSTAQPEQDFRGKKVVHLLQEPRHRTVFNDGDVYLLDVQMNPGDTSFPHTHDAPIMTTQVHNANGPVSGRVGVNLDYAERNFTHEISNAGPGLMRIIALTSYSAGVEGNGDAPQGMTVEPEVENRWFRSYRLMLEPGAETPPQTHRQPTFIIMASRGNAHVSREDGVTAELLSHGDWTFRAEDSAFQLRNMGTEMVEVVINEARR